MIELLVASRALELGSFTLKSGRVSPYFINMGRALSTGEFATKTAKAYVKEIFMKLQDIDYIHGPAYKGIPLAALVSATLFRMQGINVRWGYDRKEEKNYGDPSEKAIVGDLRDSDRVLMIDDVITTGETKVENWEKLTAARKNLNCRGILVAVDRQEKEENGESVSSYLQKRGLTLFSIVKITEVFEYLQQNPVNGKIHVDDTIMRSFEEYFAQYGV